MQSFDFTNQGRRPTAAQIVRRWRESGKPHVFEVTYGETFAVFERTDGVMRWLDHGNGCRGVNRTAVVNALCKETLT